MGILSNNQISTHFIQKISNREQLIHECKIIPLEVVIRNIASGSICKRLGIKEGLIFEEPIIEFYYKNDQLNDPIVNNNHMLAPFQRPRGDLDLRNRSRMVLGPLISLKNKNSTNAFLISPRGGSIFKRGGIFS